MSKEILEKIAELKAGQDKLRAEMKSDFTGLRVEVLAAIGQSNDATIGAINALGASLKDTRDKLRAINS